MVTKSKLPSQALGPRPWPGPILGPWAPGLGPQARAPAPGQGPQASGPGPRALGPGRGPEAPGPQAPGSGPRSPGPRSWAPGPRPWAPVLRPRVPGPRPRAPGPFEPWALGPGATPTNSVTFLEWIPTLMSYHHLYNIGFSQLSFVPLPCVWFAFS